MSKSSQRAISPKESQVKHAGKQKEKRQASKKARKANRPKK